MEEHGENGEDIKERKVLGNCKDRRGRRRNNKETIKIIRKIVEIEKRKTNKDNRKYIKDKKRANKDNRKQREHRKYYTSLNIDLEKGQNQPKDKISMYDIFRASNFCRAL